MTQRSKTRLTNTRPTSTRHPETPLLKTPLPPHSKARLTTTQRRILAQAAVRLDGAILPTPEDLPIRGRALARTLDALLRRRLIEAGPAAGDATPDRREDDAATLQISATGRQALADPRSGAGSEESESSEFVEQQPEPVRTAVGTEHEHGLIGGAADAHTASDARPSTMAAPRVRAEAAVQAIAALTNGALADAVKVPSTDRAAPDGEPRSRPGGKLGLVLRCLETGASLGELVDMTGWQPHTVRAALSRLRASGWPISPAVEDGRKTYRLSQPRG